MNASAKIDVDHHLAVALRYAAAGAAVFPIDCVTKQPPKDFRWRMLSTSEEGRLREFWRVNPGAGVAIDLAKTGLVTIDLDRHEGSPDGVAAYRILSALHEPLGPDVPVVETAGGGEHLIFRNLVDTPLTNARGALPTGIDVRGAGGYIVAAGTVRPDGTTWKRAEGTADLVDALQFDAVPVVPPWIVEIIRSKEQPEANARSRQQEPTGANERVRAYVDAAVAAECEKVARAPSGARNETLNKAAFALGQFVGAGELDAAWASDVLFAAAISSGLVKEDGPRSARATVRSGLEAGQRKPRDLSDVGSRESAFFREERAESTSDHTRDGTFDETAPLDGFLFDGDAAIEPPPSLVKRLIPYEGIAFIGGQSGAGKTFLAVELSACLASGTPFFGHKVCERVGVVISQPKGKAPFPRAYTWLAK